MRKGIWLSLGAFILIGIIAFAIWYINEEGKIRTGSKDAFIPYNSAFVISVNQKPEWTPEMEQALGQDIKAFRKHLLVRVADTLQQEGYVIAYPYVMAARLEGKKDIAFLYVMDHKDVLSRSEVSGFLNQIFAAGQEKVRKYDRYKIYTLQQGKEEIYFAVCGSIILISDSDLYIEDGLKQFDLEATGEQVKPHYQNLNKYFSAVADVNIFLNTTVFTEIMPLYLQINKLFPHLKAEHFFKWGALDGEFRKEGIGINGFMQYEGADKSYIRVLEKQQPRECAIDGVVPARLISLGMLNLSQFATYFSALEAYRYSIGQKEKVYNRKQQYVKMFGKEREEELQKLLQGEFAIVDLAFNESTQERDGVIIAALKSGSLGKALLQKMLESYARFDDKSLEHYSRQYKIDREKSFTYYSFPVEDLATMYWGYLFEGIRCKYVFVEDNYWVFASSENAVKSFINDYVHGSVIRDADWYRKLKTKLAGKYNLSYFARIPEMLPLYKSLMRGEARSFMTEHAKELEIFPSLALQWSNEGELLYNTLFLSIEPIQDDIQPHVLWQTRLEGRVSMKPVPVTNHVTGDREIFVQDDNHTVYLINDAGRVLWKVPVDGRINSEVYQVDLFKNGKLQYLFSTPTRMYLIDRNGNAAGRFPLTFRAQCDQGITVFDYDNTKEYRIFAPCADRQVYLYGLDGNLVKGWEPAKTDKPIVSKVQHYRVDGKDYIVFGDRYRFYILDRKGKERVNVSTVFDLPEKTNIYFLRKQGEARIAFADRGGNVQLVGFDGTTKNFKTEGLTEHFQMNVADMNFDGVEDLVFSNARQLVVYQSDGKLLYEKEIESKTLDFPYVYRFSGADIRIGLTDPEQGNMFLLDVKGNLTKGFPIAGDSPFSIVFSGNDGFFLFAGVDNGSLIKYKVQR